MSILATEPTRYGRTLNPARLLLAVPVPPKTPLLTIPEEVDEMIYVEMPHPFQRVDDAYASFPEITDDEARTAPETR